MKKRNNKKSIKEKTKSNIKFIIGLIVGLTLTGGAYAATILFDSEEVSYDNTTSGLTSTNVQDALTELNTKANTWLNPNDMGTPTNYIFDGANKPTTSSPTTPPSGKNVYLGLYADQQYGVCIKRNGTQHCFRYNNWMAERLHIQKVFSDDGCSVDSGGVLCIASDFTCIVSSLGDVFCNDRGASERCNVSGGGSVLCY